MTDPEPQAVAQALAAAVNEAFPTASPTKAYGMDGWQVPLPASVRPAKVGTMDPSKILLLCRAGKSGITLHVWNPLDHGVIQRHEEELVAAGFQPMVGCIRYTKKQPYPVEVVRRFLLAMRKGMGTAITNRRPSAATGTKARPR